MPRRVIVLTAINNFGADRTMQDVVVRFRLFADVTLEMSEENILLEFERFINADCLDKVRITIEDER